MKDIIVKVIQEDINQGKRRSCFDCPIAIAVTRLGYCNVAVGEEEFCIYDPKLEKWYDVTLPVEARNFIYRFDNNFDVYPIQFEFGLWDSQQN